MRSIPCFLIFASLCGVLLQCSPNYEPYQEKSEEKSNNTASVSHEIVQPTAEEDKQKIEEVNRRKAEEAEKTKQRVEAATKIQTVVRKRNAEKKSVALKQAEKEEQRLEIEELAIEASYCDPSPYYKTQKTPDRVIRGIALNLLGRSPDSPVTGKTPPRTPTRKEAEKILQRSEESKPRE